MIITAYEENRVNISIELHIKNVLFQRFKQKTTEATLLKGNYTPEKFNDNTTSATRTIGANSRRGLAL